MGGCLCASGRHSAQKGRRRCLSFLVEKTESGHACVYTVKRQRLHLKLYNYSLHHLASARQHHQIAHERRFTTTTLTSPLQAAAKASSDQPLYQTLFQIAFRHRVLKHPRRTQHAREKKEEPLQLHTATATTAVRDAAMSIVDARHVLTAIVLWFLLVLASAAEHQPATSSAQKRAHHHHDHHRHGHRRHRSREEQERCDNARNPIIIVPGEY